MTVIVGRLGKASHPCRAGRAGRACLAGVAVWACGAGAAGRACRVEWPCGPAWLELPWGLPG
jgi:hypothetical protein